MHYLAKKFLEENESNKDLYDRAKLYNDEEAALELKEEFSTYLSKIHFLSYLDKTLKFTALQFINKNKKTNYKEKLILNEFNENLDDEVINTISDKPLDYLIEIFDNDNNFDFTEIITDELLLKSIKELTQKQKKILFMKYIQDKEEKKIANELNISIQSVNKTKNTILNKLKKCLER